MSDKVRDTLGKFAPKSVVPRKVRSVNLTDEAWQWLATVAEKAGMSRNDYLEALAQGNSPFMETAKSQFQPFIEMVPTKTKTDAANIRQQPNSKLFPFMGTVRTEVDSPTDEVEAVRAENQQLHIELGNFASQKESLKQEQMDVRAQLETERADRKQIEAQISQLKQSSSPVATLSEKSTPDAATILSQLARQAQKLPSVTC